MTKKTKKVHYLARIYITGIGMSDFYVACGVESGPGYKTTKIRADVTCCRCMKHFRNSLTDEQKAML
jgi:hypothetical protein